MLRSRPTPLSAVAAPRRARVLAFLLVAGWSGLAAAQPGEPSEAEPPQAEVLFREGFEALEAGNYDLACRKLAESLALARKVGTVLNLARCEESRGRRAEARELFREGLTLLDPSDERRGIAQERFDVLDRSVPAVQLSLAEGAPAGTVVSAAGQEWLVGEQGTALRLNAGSYVFEVSAPGHEGRKVPVTLKESERVTLTVEPGPRIEQGAPPPTAPPPVAPPPEEPSSGPNTLAWVFMGVGATGLIAAGVTGGMVLSDQSTVEDDCEAGVCQTQAGVDAASRGDTLLVVNAIAWGVGLVGIGTGAALFLWGGDDEPTRASGRLSPSATPTGLSMTWAGAF